ncbi:Uncharacterized conserved protein [Hydrocarboniphaga daqingensis]|uniref:DNA 3'-5' helicase II n=1 Tax=Hydrocarboniphaga daqingensis TaxID=490188 RepID=A0A1M5QQQ9_9GAMM|nr:NERD domain-containing protein [Hydrocarboniphaga daqingensis]SHH15923.1 Uncharacterized conserved protein [Hydrocarboniphaga daqingensis]
MPQVLGGIPHNVWEARVLQKLRRQLPADWIVLAGVSWAVRSEGYIRDGQADFVVLVPGSGMCVLEVKGSSAIRIREDGSWQRHQGGDVWIDVSPTPFEQATSNMHSLAAIAEGFLGRRNFPGRFSFLVAYPNGEIVGRPTTYDISTLLSKRDMEDLPARIRASLSARGAEALGLQFAGAVVTDTANGFVNKSFRVSVVDTSDDAQADVAEVNKLTRQQFSALKGVFDFPSVAVTGPAGSGKTLIAMWRLRALVTDGRNAIYVCFNKNLAEWLRCTNVDLADHIHSMHKMFLSMTGLRVPSLSGAMNEFFDVVLPNAAFDAASNLDERDKYDAVIVDEGQDLGEASELAVREMLKSSRGQWLLFADEKQNVYQAGTSRYLTAEVVFRLHHNCRNTERVNAATNNYCGHKIESVPEISRGVMPLIDCPGNPLAQINAAWKLCSEWRALGSVAILSPFRLDNSILAGVQRAHGLQLSQDISDLGKPDVVVFSTIKAFKGIEASAVVVVDVDVPESTVSFTVEDLYVACTRPTARLALICRSAEARDWFEGKQCQKTNDR